jgi:hypothetical protein
LSGCASFEKSFCTQELASVRGYTDMMNGNVFTPSLWFDRECKASTGYSYQDYSRDYNEGFEKAKNCNSQGAYDLGVRDAADGKDFNSSVSKLKICSEDRVVTSNLMSFYENGYKKAFCQESHVIDVASKDGQFLRKKTQDSFEFRLCEGNNKKTFFKVYEKFYYLAARKKSVHPSVKTREDLVSQPAQGRLVNLENIIISHETEKLRMDSERLHRERLDKESFKQENFNKLSNDSLLNGSLNKVIRYQNFKR